MTDFNHVPSLVLFLIGFIFTIILLISMAISRSGFLTSDLGKWILALLVVIVIGSLGMALGIAGLMFYPDWFSLISLPNQIYMAFRFPIGVAVALTNFQIAMERYFLICHEKSVPRQIVFWIGVHAGLTIIILWVCAATAETTNYRRPGGDWQRYLTLVCILQYMALAFGGLTYLYAKTYFHVYKMLKDMQDLVHGNDSEQNALRMRVLTNCILMTLAFSTCYSMEAVITVYSIVSTGFTVPDWLDSLATTVMSCDTIITPLLVMHLHSNVFKSSFIIGSILSKGNKSRPSQINQSQGSQYATKTPKPNISNKSPRSSLH
ncbi:hypothetical protein BCR33DRAFT_548939 [Rhizoclosmatium globosum]|uniref:Uncharacterized protein n=1 Tax=Rhizoclosmatium globosum TaxID=329046 RepID=A0A1Y2B925_9FUNG|nr:hypothetical protein BCR33DRAFT_548939 [Rhizoclosmatium globosum]|eukprot:ORY31348.1 hypothetical protein BCR33DRAFT_548939 [Rhizoclosmatium globosum]